MTIAGDDDVREEAAAEDTSSKKGLDEKLSDNCSQVGESGHVATGQVERGCMEGDVCRM